MTEVLQFHSGRKVPPDADQREQALNIRASWAVEAPAGSGKTGLLLQRYLKLLADESVEEPEEVLAMTFTVKATAELRDRVLQQLEGAHRSSGPSDDFERATRPLALAVLERNAKMDWRLMEQTERLNIRSIDSLCAEVARMLPLLSGSGGRLTPVETPEPLYREAARRTLMRLGEGREGLHEALQMLLRHRDGNLNDCVKLIAEMLQWRDQWVELVPLGRQANEEDHLEKRLRPALERTMAEVTRQFHGAGLPMRYPEEQWSVAKALFLVLNYALVDLKLLFAERGECDFAELSLAARYALRQEGGAEEFAQAAGMGLRHLLVDEMQDTSLGQYELIEQLTRGWDGASQTVFLVGDPKQSIYLFRQARVERFLRTMQEERLGSLRLGVLRLTANFRSQSGLVAQFNADFGRLFPAEIGSTLEGDVPFVAAQAVCKAAGSAGRVWHANPLPYGATRTSATARQRAQADAQEIRELILKWRARELPAERDNPDPKKRKAWKIAILVRARTHLDKITAALKQEPAIPCRAVAIDPLEERQEVMDLLALTRALLHPADRVAWFAVLHAPWCGLGLADLHMLAGGDGTDWRERSMEHMIAERGAMLSTEGRGRLARTWDVLQTALAELGRMTTAQWVERTWRSLGGDAPLGAEEMANARCYLRLLDEIERESQGIDLMLLEQRIQKLFAEPSSQEDAVDVMTIHGAKGLEWDFVIVPGLERMPGFTREHLLSWLEMDLGEDEGPHFLLAPIHGTGEESKELNEFLKNVQKKREAAERRRLFYVACTRAKEELHLFASPKRKKDGEVTRPPQSLLEAAWPAAEEHFAGVVVPFPVAAPGVVVQMATVTATPTRIMERLPQGFDARRRWTSAKPVSAVVRAVRAERFFERPEGSFAARAFGNAVHAFLEVLAGRIAAGAAAADLLAELPAWEGRVAAVLRAAGVAPGVVKEMAAATLRGLGNTLRDEAGRWVLAAHAAARSEQALESEERMLRLDRSFYAGAEPLSAGESHLWIVDFKTGEPGGRDAEAYFAAERETYRPQMETYAEAYADEGRPVRLALYYPLASRLVLL